MKQSLTRKVSKENGRQTICCSKHFWSTVVFCVYVLHDMMIYESSVTIYLELLCGASSAASIACIFLRQKRGANSRTRGETFLKSYSLDIFLGSEWSFCAFESQ